MSTLASVSNPKRFKLLKNERNPELVKIISEGNYTLARLAQQFGISIYYLKKNYGAKSKPRRSKVTPEEAEPSPRPPAPAAAEAGPLPKVESIERPSTGLKLVALGSYLLGAWLLAIGVLVNWQYNSSQGHDWLSSLILGGQGAAYDVAPSFLMPFAGYIWSKKHYIMAVVALALWAMCLLMSAITVTSFSSTHTGDALKSRTNVASRHGVLTAQLAAAQRDLDALRASKEARDKQITALAQAIEKARGNIAPSRLQATNDCDAPQVTLSTSFIMCDPLIQLRAKKAEAERQAAKDAARIADLPAEITRLSDKLAELPAVTDKNPNSGFSNLTGGLVQPELVESVRSNGTILTIILPGCLFLFAWVMYVYSAARRENHHQARLRNSGENVCARSGRRKLT